VICEGGCEIRALVDGLLRETVLKPGNLITAVDGVSVSGETIVDVLASGYIGSTVKVQALQTRTLGKFETIEVDLKRRSLSVGNRSFKFFIC
jgi:C-terminal processing protease CtpA/Prc